MLLVVNHCKNHNVVINFDFSRGCQNNILETKKNMPVLHCFFKAISLGTQLCQCLLVGTLPAGIPSRLYMGVPEYYQVRIKEHLPLTKLWWKSWKSYTLQSGIRSICKNKEVDNCAGRKSRPHWWDRVAWDQSWSADVFVHVAWIGVL